MFAKALDGIRSAAGVFASIVEQTPSRVSLPSSQTSVSSTAYSDRRGTQRCHPPLPRPHQRKPKTLYLDQGPKQNHRRCQTRAPSVRFDPPEIISPKIRCGARASRRIPSTSCSTRRPCCSEAIRCNSYGLQLPSAARTLAKSSIRIPATATRLTARGAYWRQKQTRRGCSRKSPAANIVSDLFTAAGVIASGTSSVGLGLLPASMYIEGLIFQNLNANAITGGVNVGSSVGAADIVSALAVAGNALIVVADALILKRAFSAVAPTSLFVSAGGSWNGASLNIKTVLRPF